MPPKKHRQKKQLNNNNKTSSVAKQDVTPTSNVDNNNNNGTKLTINEMLLEEQSKWKKQPEKHHTTNSNSKDEPVVLIPYESGTVVCKDCAKKDHIPIFYLPEFSEMVSCTSYFTNMRRVSTLNMLKRIWAMDFNQTESLEERKSVSALNTIHYNPVPVAWIPDPDGARGQGEYVFGLPPQKIEEEIGRLKKLVYQPPWRSAGSSVPEISGEVYNPERSKNQLSQLYREFVKLRKADRKYENDEFKELQILEPIIPLQMSPSDIKKTGGVVSEQKKLDVLLYGTGVEGRDMLPHSISNNSIYAPLLNDDMTANTNIADGFEMRKYDDREDMLVSPDQLFGLMYLSKSVVGNGTELTAQTHKDFQKEIPDLVAELNISPERWSGIFIDGGFTMNMLFMHYLYRKGLDRQDFRYKLNVAVSYDANTSFVIPLHGLVLAASEEQVADTLIDLFTHTVLIRDPGILFRQMHNYWNVEDGRMHDNMTIGELMADAGREMKKSEPNSSWAKYGLQHSCDQMGLTEWEKNSLVAFHSVNCSSSGLLYVYRRMLKPSKLAIRHNDNKRYWHLGWKGVVKRTDYIIKALDYRQETEIPQQFYENRIAGISNRYTLWKAARSVDMPVDDFIEWLSSDESVVRPANHSEIMLRTKQQIVSLMDITGNSPKNIAMEMKQLSTDKLVQDVFGDAPRMIERLSVAMEFLMMEYKRAHHNPFYTEAFSVFLIRHHICTRTLDHMNEPTMARIMEDLLYRYINSGEQTANLRSMNSRFLSHYVESLEPSSSSYDSSSSSSSSHGKEENVYSEAQIFGSRHALAMMFTDSTLLKITFFSDTITSNPATSVPLSAFFSWNYNDPGFLESPFGQKDLIPVVGERYEHPVWRAALRASHANLELSNMILKYAAPVNLSTTNGEQQAPLLQASMAGFIVKHLMVSFVTDFSISMHWMHFMQLLSHEEKPLVRHNVWRNLRELGMPNDISEEEFEVLVESQGKRDMREMFGNKDNEAKHYRYRHHHQSSSGDNEHTIPFYETISNERRLEMINAVIPQADHPYTYLENYIRFPKGGMALTQSKDLLGGGFFHKGHPLMHVLRLSFTHVMVRLMYKNQSALIHSPAYPFTYLDLFVPVDYQKVMMIINKIVDQKMEIVRNRMSERKRTELLKKDPDAYVTKNFEELEDIKRQIAADLKIKLPHLLLKKPDYLYTNYDGVVTESQPSHILIPRGSRWWMKPTLQQAGSGSFMKIPLVHYDGSSTMAVLAELIDSKFDHVSHQDYLHALFDPNYNVRLQLYNVMYTEHYQTTLKNITNYIMECIVLSSKLKASQNYFNNMRMRMITFECSHKLTK